MALERFFGFAYYPSGMMRITNLTIPRDPVYGFVVRRTSLSRCTCRMSFLGHSRCWRAITRDILFVRCRVFDVYRSDATSLCRVRNRVVRCARDHSDVAHRYAVLARGHITRHGTVICPVRLEPSCCGCKPAPGNPAFLPTGVSYVWCGAVTGLVPARVHCARALVYFTKFYVSPSAVLGDTLFRMHSVCTCPYNKWVSWARPLLEISPVAGGIPPSCRR